MSITVNGKTINALNVGNTHVEKVLVRQNASSNYITVYFAELHEENVTVSGTTKADLPWTDDSGTKMYLTAPITKTFTSTSGTVEVVNATATSNSSNVFTIAKTGASIKATLCSTSSGVYVSATIKVTYVVCFSSIPAYNVVQVNSTASHQFKLNSNGYYESQCKGIKNGWSLCKVEFNIAGNYTLQCISYGESSYDFGILSNINHALDASNKVDSTNVKKSFKGLSSDSVQSVSYSGVKVGDYIYVKYRKDSTSNKYNDSLQFKVVKN